MLIDVNISPALYTHLTRYFGQTPESAVTPSPVDVKFPKGSKIKIVSIKDSTKHGILSSDMKKYFEMNAPAMVMGREGSYLYVATLLMDGAGARSYHVCPADVEMLPPELQQNDAFAKYVNDFWNNRKAMVQAEVDKKIKEVESMIAPPEKSWQETDYRTTDSQITGYDFKLDAGVLVKTDKFILYKKFNNDYDSFFVQEDNGNVFRFCLPVDWVNSQGYTEEGVKDWIAFVSEFGLDVHVSYKGIVQLKDHNPYPKMDEMYNLAIMGKKLSFSTNTILLNNAYYAVEMIGNECGAINAFVFRLIMSLQRSKEGRLPGLTMQLASSDEWKGSKWEAFLATLSFVQSPMFIRDSRSMDSTQAYLPDVFASENSVDYFMERLSRANSVDEIRGLLFIKKVPSELANAVTRACNANDHKTIFDKLKQM